MAEIAGVPEAALRAFSQRRAQVLDYLERRGSSGFYAAKVAAIETRDRKEPVDLPRMRLEWEARAAEHGLGRRELKRLLGRTVARELDERDVAEVAARLAGPDGLTEHALDVHRDRRGHGLGAGARPGRPGRAGARAGRALPRRWSRSRRSRPRRSGGRPCSRPPSCSATSGSRCNSPRTAGGVRVPTVSPATVEQVAREREPMLGREQVAMVHAAALEPGARRLRRRPRRRRQDDRARRARRRLPAGRASSRSAPHPPGVAAANLAAETGIPSGTLHRLLAEARQRGGLPRRCLLVVDEAAMADTRTLTRVLLAGRAGRGQGGARRRPGPASRRRPGRPVRRDRRAQRRDRAARQPPPARRARTARARRCSATAAAATTSPTPPSTGRLTVAADRVEAKAQLVADWWQAARGDLAGQRDDRLPPRRRRRAQRRRPHPPRPRRAARPRPPPPRRTAPSSPSATGSSAPATTAASTSPTAPAAPSAPSTASSGRSRSSSTTSRRLTLPARYLDAGHVAHAYALTGHKTQGLTRRARVRARRRPARAPRVGLRRPLPRPRADPPLHDRARSSSPTRRPTAPSPTARSTGSPTPSPAPQQRRSPSTPRRPDPTRPSAPRSHARPASSESNDSHSRRNASTRRDSSTRRTARSPGWACSAAPATDEPSATRSANTNRRLARLDRELARLDRELRVTRERAFELARAQPRLERGLTREPTLGRGLGRERGLDRGIER